MLVVSNSDTPGMIGRVGTIMGEAGVNVDDMDVGTNADGEAALMVLSTSARVSDEVIAMLLAVDGVYDANAIELD
jgi:D-3-phosphoglycerate dehydrogenase